MLICMIVMHILKMPLSFLDITNEKTFLNAREWISSAKEVISVDRNYSTAEMDSIVFVLVGNKLDLAENDMRR